MFNSPTRHGIFPTSDFFKKIDDCHASSMKAVLEWCIGEIGEIGEIEGMKVQHDIDDWAEQYNNKVSHNYALTSLKQIKIRRSYHWNDMVEVLELMFPKGKCKERGQALVMLGYIELIIQGKKHLLDELFKVEKLMQ